MKERLAKLKEQLPKLLSEYGPVAVVVWFVIFGAVLCGFALAIQSGVDVDTPAGAVGVWGSAYLATQLAKPLRIIATLMLTPLVARQWRRFRPLPPQSALEDDEDKVAPSSTIDHSTSTSTEY
ncbi:MAG: hypothetical protein R3C68_02220 [Myxococcota bacterium]